MADNPVFDWLQTGNPVTPAIGHGLDLYNENVVDQILGGALYQLARNNMWGSMIGSDATKYAVLDAFENGGHMGAVDAYRQNEGALKTMIGEFIADPLNLLLGLGLPKWALQGAAKGSKVAQAVEKSPTLKQAIDIAAEARDPIGWVAGKMIGGPAGWAWDQAKQRIPGLGLSNQAKQTLRERNLGNLMTQLAQAGMTLEDVGKAEMTRKILRGKAPISEEAVQQAIDVLNRQGMGEDALDLTKTWEQLKKDAAATKAAKTPNAPVELGANLGMAAPGFAVGYGVDQGDQDPFQRMLQGAGLAGVAGLGAVALSRGRAIPQGTIRLVHFSPEADLKSVRPMMGEGRGSKAGAEIQNQLENAYDRAAIARGEKKFKPGFVDKSGWYAFLPGQDPSRIETHLFNRYNAYEAQVPLNKLLNAQTGPDMTEAQAKAAGYIGIYYPHVQQVRLFEEVPVRPLGRAQFPGMKANVRVNTENFESHLAPRLWAPGEGIGSGVIPNEEIYQALANDPRYAGRIRKDPTGYVLPAEALKEAIDSGLQAGPNIPWNQLRNDSMEEFLDKVAGMRDRIGAGEIPPEVLPLSLILSRSSIQRGGFPMETIWRQMDKARGEGAASAFMQAQKPTIQVQLGPSADNPVGATMRPEIFHTAKATELSDPDIALLMTALARSDAFANPLERQRAIEVGIRKIFGAADNPWGDISDTAMVTGAPVMRNGVPVLGEGRKPWMDVVPQLWQEVILPWAKRAGAFADEANADRLLQERFWQNSPAGFAYTKATFPLNMMFNPEYATLDSRMLNKVFGLSDEMAGVLDKAPDLYNRLAQMVYDAVPQTKHGYGKQWLPWEYLTGEKADYRSIMDELDRFIGFFKQAEAEAQASGRPMADVVREMSGMLPKPTPEALPTPAEVKAWIGVSVPGLDKFPAGATASQIRQFLPGLFRVFDQAGVKVEELSRGLGQWKEEGRPFAEGDLHLRLQGTPQAIEWAAAAIGHGGDQWQVYVMHDGGPQLMARLEVKSGLGSIMDQRLSDALYGLMGDNGWQAFYNKRGDAAGFHIVNTMGDTPEAEQAFMERLIQVVDVLQANGVQLVGGFMDPIVQYRVTTKVLQKAKGEGNYEEILRRGPGPRPSGQDRGGNPGSLGGGSNTGTAGASPQAPPKASATTGRLPGLDQEVPVGGSQIGLGAVAPLAGMAGGVSVDQDQQPQFDPQRAALMSLLALGMIRGRGTASWLREQLGGFSKENPFGVIGQRAGKPPAEFPAGPARPAAWAAEFPLTGKYSPRQAAEVARRLVLPTCPTLPREPL